MRSYTHPSYQIVFNLFRKYFPNLSGKSILDSGCGNGYLLDLINPANIHKYLGYDVSEHAIRYAKLRFKKYKNIKFLHTKPNLNTNGFKTDYFDAIFSIGVLQYLNESEIQDFFKMSRRSLKNDGRVFISCTTDHTFYKWFSLYNLVLPSHVNNRKKLLRLAKENGLKCEYQKESGLFFGPLFSHNIVLLFDIFDKIIFRSRGKLGPIGKISRIISTFILQFEYYIPIDYGYTLYLVLKK